MTQSKADRRSTLVDQPPDPEVLAFRRQFDDRSPLDLLVREGARKMLQAAINAELDWFVEQHRDPRDEQGRRMVVKNARLPATPSSRPSPRFGSAIEKRKGNGTRRAGLAMMFKLAQSASKKWRRLNCHEKITLVIEGRIFKDGIMQEEVAA